MVFNLKNKVVLVTGAAIGIGAHVVDILLEEDVKHVAFLDVLQDKGIERQNELNKKHGDKVKYYNCDVTQEDQLFGVFQSVLDEHGYIDVVINNAGIMNDSPDFYKKEILVNVTGLVTSTFKAIEIMRKDKGGKGGVVLNVSSIAALSQSHILPVYCGTKSAVLQFSNCIGMPEYYSITGVRVIAICFGKTDTALLTRPNLGNFDEIVTRDLKAAIKDNTATTQMPESAARGVVEAVERGDSGSTWLAIADKPVKDITEHIKRSYQSFLELISC